MLREGRVLLLLCIALAILGAGCGGQSSSDGGATGDGNGPWFRSERGPASVYDKQEEITAFKVGGGFIVSCRSGTYEGTLEAKSELLPLHVTFRGCEFERKVARVETGGCTYVLEAGSKEKQTPVRISCPDGEAIGISLAGGCELEVGPQTAKGGAVFTSTGRGPERTFDSNAVLTAGATAKAGGAECAALAGSGASIEFGIELYGSTAGAGGQQGRVGLWIE